VSVETLPADVAIDAWTGTETARGTLASKADLWGSRSGIADSQTYLAFGQPSGHQDWAAADNGYGVLLPLDCDIPEPIQTLQAKRPGTVILRWASSDRIETGKLRKLRANGQPQDIDIAGSDYGTADGRIPRYILIAAPPTEIPWRVQYDLSLKSYVGRLPFSGDALAPYIKAMLDDWSQGTPNLTTALVWATDYGPTDITRTMAAAIAAPLRDRLKDTVSVEAVIGAGAKVDALLSKLEAKPGLVVTSSHGSTPIDDPDLLVSTLGLPVGQDRHAVDLDELDAQMPCGSLWFAQACCSAGSSGESLYTQLLSADSSAARVVSQVAALGHSTVAPAALRLLSRESPVRAVLGHVEPTFDWTLQDGSTGQLYGGALVTALSANLYSGQPIGMALAEYRQQVGVLNTQYHTLRDEAASNTSLRPKLTRLRLTALDRQALVLLGDPTVAFPSLVVHKKKRRIDSRVTSLDLAEEVQFPRR
jgi:hypothetical protein